MKATNKVPNDYSVLSAEMSYFKIAYEQKGIQAAARRIGQDAAHVSRMVNRLENNLQTKLFVRHKSGMRATSEGERLYVAISSAQTEFNRKISNNIEITTPVRIGFSPTVGFSYFSQQIIEDLFELQLQPEFKIASSIELIEAIKVRSLDFAIVPQSIKFPGLISRKIATEDLVLCSQSQDPTGTLLLHPDMLGLEKLVREISYQQRWMITDYFVITQFLSQHKKLMGVLPESLITTGKNLKVIQRFTGIGQIHALTWPGSPCIELIKKISTRQNKK